MIQVSENNEGDAPVWQHRPLSISRRVAPVLYPGDLAETGERQVDSA
jgi:hypothetical protein